MATCESDFYCLNGETAKCRMMFRNTYLPVASFEQLDCMGVKLPFRSSGWTKKEPPPRPQVVSACNFAHA
ncbi:hypothetical protein X801_08074 [Opisthorchis viverrini]|uniref:Uncharacterized protein n=1 Tax=Opisthorchis viverrini TaxID=6198 RepID=A0A1S8WNZ6_OPIVI|nr:hypothetical protein X801_08074 [Opisthorchis viverrini]